MSTDSCKVMFKLSRVKTSENSPVFKNSDVNAEEFVVKEKLPEVKKALPFVTCLPTKLGEKSLSLLL